MMTLLKFLILLVFLSGCSVGMSGVAKYGVPCEKGDPGATAYIYKYNNGEAVYYCK